MREAVMIVGCPAAGKSTISRPLIEEGYVHLNRDKVGGSTIGLLQPMVEALKTGKSVVLDNTFAIAEIRKPFIEAATKLDVPIRCVWLNTSIEDAQINALHRMWDRYGLVFYNAAQMKAHPQAKKDPNIFPIQALFKYRKEFEPPTVAEGFSVVGLTSFVRKPYPGTKKAIILDYDGTLRRCRSGAHYPTDPDDIEILPGRREKILKLRSEGWLILGISNQSGVGKGEMTEAQAVACFNRTNELLGTDIPYAYSTTNPPAITYCRKPQSGIGVMFIRAYNLSPREVTMVGDLGTDKSFAERLGFKFAYAEKFFGS